MQNIPKTITLYIVTFLTAFESYSDSNIGSQHANKHQASYSTEILANNISLARRAFVITLRDYNKQIHLQKHPRFAKNPESENTLQYRSTMHDQAYTKCYEDESCKKAMQQSLYTSSDPRIEILALTEEGRDILAEFENDMQACNENEDCQSKVKEAFNEWYAKRQETTSE